MIETTWNPGVSCFSQAHRSFFGQKSEKKINQEIDHNQEKEN